MGTWERIKIIIGVKSRELYIKEKSKTTISFPFSSFPTGDAIVFHLDNNKTRIMPAKRHQARQSEKGKSDENRRNRSDGEYKWKK